MKRLVIAVDCDDVLVRTTPFFVEEYNARYGTQVTLALAHSEDDSIWGVPHEKMLERFAEMLETGAYRALSPSPDEIQILQELARHHELHVVTARKEGEREVTQQMLDTYLPGVFTSLDLVGWRGSKGEVCARIHADVLVDDSARHLHNAIEEGLPKSGALLFGEYPWNEESSTHEDLHVCRTWQDVARTIDAIARSE